ncbi:MAG: RDD family protein [Alphaproteobacteria bacterium]|nr:RDD family protein [Alphaproteobacteria bacterium]
MTQGGATVASNLPEPIDADDADFSWSAEPPDPLDRPDFYDGVLWRRAFAFVIDIALLTGVIVALAIFNLFTLFIFAGLIGLIIALPLLIVYDTATVGSRQSGTLGMRCMGIETRAWTGARPTYFQAFVASALYWFLTPLTSGLILIWALFDDRRRQLHDLLSGTVVIRAARARRANESMTIEPERQ